MDPISAAGIGMGVVSLVFEVFSGCIKGYQIFIEADDMPENYQHLRVRLRIEQTRLLQWGDKVGLLHDILETPSMIIQTRRNLILDVLLEMQALFRSCVKITKPLDKIVDGKSASETQEDKSFAKRFPKGTNHLIAKVMSVIDKTPQVPSRLKWAVITQENFEGLVEKLIRLNNSIEGFLDKSDMNELQLMQQQTLMAILQLNSKVDELTELSKALRLDDKSSGEVTESNDITPKEVEPHTAQRVDDFAQLASFKAQQIQVEKSKPSMDAIPIDDLKLDKDAPRGTARSTATLNGKKVWVEWKEYDADPNPESVWNKTIRNRVENLVKLLGSSDKPSTFRAPKALGFRDDTDDKIDRYGIIYQLPKKSQQQDLKPFSLYDLFSGIDMPSLTHRMGLARAIAESLMYLHSVNWLHKGFRSDNILFFGSSKEDVDLTSPVIAGFEYARPDVVDALTEPVRRHTHHDIYRHPDQLGGSYVSSRKSFDIYGLGVVLVEIALWQQMDKLLGMGVAAQNSKTELQKVRTELLSKQRLSRLTATVGQRYCNAVERCLKGNERIRRGTDESEPAVGVEMQLWFSTQVVSELQSITL